MRLSYVLKEAQHAQQDFQETAWKIAARATTRRTIAPGPQGTSLLCPTRFARTSCKSLLPPPGLAPHQSRCGIPGGGGVFNAPMG